MIDVPATEVPTCEDPSDILDACDICDILASLVRKSIGERDPDLPILVPAGVSRKGSSSFELSAKEDAWLSRFVPAVASNKFLDEDSPASTGMSVT